MMLITRRLALGAGAALLVTGCQGGGSSEISAGDMVIGSPDAKVTLLEYFSATCSACAAFHATVYPAIKTNYVDTGRIRYAFRELLTAPQSVSLAAFQVARCGNATGDQYMARVGAVFQSQREFLSGSPQAIRERLIELGRASGLSREQVEACLVDESARARVTAMEEQARLQEVQGTPTLFLDGERVPQDAYNVEGLSALIDARIAAAG